MEQSLKEVSSNKWYIVQEYWRQSSTNIVDYQTSYYKITTSLKYIE